MTAASTLAPTTGRIPREEARLVLVGGAGDAGAVRVGVLWVVGATAGAAGTAGEAVAGGAAGCGAFGEIGSGVIFDHSVMTVALLLGSGSGV
jgi:hypothetical protein